MIAIAMPSSRQGWSTMSFTSTLYLYPVLDLLLRDVPDELRPEIRLGLQEALVNAAKHGNRLDPSKTIVVHFSRTKEGYYWTISDEGSGFTSHCSSPYPHTQLLPPEEAENGRGLSILHQIFDRVYWNQQGTELNLCKQIKKGKLRPIFST